MFNSADSASPSAVVVERIPFITRLLSGVGGGVVFLVALVLSLGAALAAPFGMFLVHRWAVRHNRRSSWIASLVGAVLASSVAAAALGLLLFALAPRPTQQQLQTAVTETRRHEPVKLPAWYTRVFPQAAHTDSVTQQLIQSPGFMTVTLLLGAAFAALLLGVLGGTLGWCGSALLRVAWSGQRAGPDSLLHAPRSL